MHEAPSFCGNCGARLTASDRFCGACGHPVASAPATAPAPPPAPDRAPPPEPIRATPPPEALSPPRDKPSVAREVLSLAGAWASGWAVGALLGTGLLAFIGYYEYFQLGLALVMLAGGALGGAMAGGYGVMLTPGVGTLGRGTLMTIAALWTASLVLALLVFFYRPAAITLIVAITGAAMAPFVLRNLVHAKPATATLRKAAIGWGLAGLIGMVPAWLWWM